MVSRDSRSAGTRDRSIRQHGRRRRGSDGNGQATHICPSQLEVAGETLVVRRVEHELHAVAAKFIKGAGQRREHTLALMIWMGGRIDGSSGTDHGRATFELPAHEGAHADRPPALFRHPHHRRAERAIDVLPPPQPVTFRSLRPSHRRSQEVDQRRVVGWRCRSNDHIVLTRCMC